jgi:hypothetical protein
MIGIVAKIMTSTLIAAFDSLRSRVNKIGLSKDSGSSDAKACNIPQLGFENILRIP